MTAKKWVFNVLISMDQAVNVLFFGDPDETISSRWGRRLRSGKQLPWYCRPIAAGIRWLDPDHFETSIEGKQ